MKTEIWWFDRLGENLNPPNLEIDPTKDIVRQLRDHAREHIITSDNYPLHGPAVQRHTLGGYDIVDARTSFTYGQARRSPSFTEKPDFGRRSFPVLPPPLTGARSLASDPPPIREASDSRSES